MPSEGMKIKKKVLKDRSWFFAKKTDVRRWGYLYLASRYIKAKLILSGPCTMNAKICYFLQKPGLERVLSFSFFLS